MGRFPVPHLLLVSVNTWSFCFPSAGILGNCQMKYVDCRLATALLLCLGLPHAWATRFVWDLGQRNSQHHCRNCMFLVLGHPVEESPSPYHRRWSVHDVYSGDEENSWSSVKIGCPSCSWCQNCSSWSWIWMPASFSISRKIVFIRFQWCSNLKGSRMARTGTRPLGLTPATSFWFVIFEKASFWYFPSLWAFYLSVAANNKKLFQHEYFKSFEDHLDRCFRPPIFINLSASYKMANMVTMKPKTN